MKQIYWIWYPGDFEIYHGLQQNFSREERGFDWPAYWYMDDCRKNVKFTAAYRLDAATEFTVYSKSSGYLLVNGIKHRFGEKISCAQGEISIEVFVGKITGVPSVYVEGEIIRSGRDWSVTDFVSQPVPAGCSSRYTKREQNPDVWEYEKREAAPVSCCEVRGGTLYDFGEELNAKLLLHFVEEFSAITLCYGESQTEALDVRMCYYSQQVLSEDDEIRRRAFRYVFIPECMPGKVELIAVHYYVDIPVRATFSCDDVLVNQIWEVARDTFQLCSGIFFVDGIKRDRWIWSGDAFQSYMINPYLMFDEDINKRTIWALRGNDPVRQHINTIVDYSMYWVISIYNHYQMTGDIEFVQMIYPKMCSMMEFLMGQLDENGFIVGRKKDWIFIDWTDMDKEGAVCAEQMLLLMCYKTMMEMERILGSHLTYEERYHSLSDKINQFFWSDEKKAYIDSFASGRKHVSRHANIFAVLFEIADDRKTELICRNVLYNDAVPQITTPYFKFYELEVLCRLGQRQEVLQQMKEYWGGILAEGATTIWEEYDPKKSGAAHYQMYGDPYGKSLCHAWGASPVYLLGRYYMGVTPTDIAYTTFEVKPDTSLFKQFSSCVPLKDGYVDITWDGVKLTVQTDCSGGILKYQGQEIALTPGMSTVIY